MAAPLGKSLIVWAKSCPMFPFGGAPTTRQSVGLAYRRRCGRITYSFTKKAWIVCVASHRTWGLLVACGISKIKIGPATKIKDKANKGGYPKYFSYFIILLAGPILIFGVPQFLFRPYFLWLAGDDINPYVMKLVNKNIQYQHVAVW